MRLPVLAFLCCSTLAAGCGGVLHVSKSLSAKRAIELARAARAADKAPYHLALAEQYLAQAEVEMTGAHAEEALAYDELAIAHASEAEAIASGTKKAAVIGTAAPPTPAAPATKAPEAAPAKKRPSATEDL